MFPYLPHGQTTCMECYYSVTEDSVLYMDLVSITKPIKEYSFYMSKPLIPNLYPHRMTVVRSRNGHLVKEGQRY